jgi:oxygen-independent coproporphyrinogen-3 oxidase
MPTLSLYLHIPFCKRRCPYCTFYHVPACSEGEGVFVDALLADVERTLEAYAEDVDIRTVYFGGGTPSSLTEASWSRIFTALRPRLSDTSTNEVTCEFNPEDVTPELLDFFTAAGVNRISLGIQTMDKKVQRRLGRCSPEINRKAIDSTLTRCSNVSFDVLLGVPQRGAASLERTMRELVEYRPAHLSVYCLERGGDAQAEVERFFEQVDPDRSAEEYLWVCQRLEGHGYRHYEVSNFALSGFESRHNRVYWEGGEYLGFGPGAHSYVGGRRFHVPPSLDDYLARAGTSSGAGRIFDDTTPDEREMERLMLELRTSSGVAVEGLRCPEDAVNGILEDELAVIDQGRLVLTNRGYLVLNDIVLRLLSAC